MTLGVGGSTITEELAKIKPFKHYAKPIQTEEFKQRLDKLVALMIKAGEQAVYLHAGKNLFYFTGMRWNPSERMVGAVVFANGDLHFIGPEFERGTIMDFMVLKGEVHCWEEHESPYSLLVEILLKNEFISGDLHCDESTPYFIIDGITKITNTFKIVNAKPLISECRIIKSDTEIALIKQTMDICLEVQKAAARIMYEGISVKEVEDFINEAFKRYGVASGYYFCIVLFGKDSAFPHGVKTPKNLEKNDVVLVDTGCVLFDYISDITRTYVFGKPNAQQRQIWEIEREAQFAAFNAAQVGATCADVDAASRTILEAHGLGPDYKLPGLPHRTGHGIGLEIHEYPYIVRGNTTKLSAGMCFSNEPMICVPNAFGIRLEDHIYITEKGPMWFTTPAHSIENPFGLKE